MKRRIFIEHSLKTVPLLLFPPSVLAACRQQNVGLNKSVIVIGAGISGLAAAKKLKEQAFNVTVLEAQDRVGGRLRTNRDLGVPFDEGASWIHGVKNNPITTLASQAGAKTTLANDEDIISYDLGGIKRTDSAYSAAEDKLYNDVLKNLKTSGSLDKSFETVFNSRYPQYANDRLWRFLLSAFVTFDLGDLDKVSSLYYDEGEEFGGDEHFIVDGYDKIPQFLAQGLDVKLNERISKIDYSQSKIKITSDKGVYEADYVIVSVPLGVLKNKSIEFSPALPTAKQTAIQKVGMNCVNKFILTWNTSFWDDVQYISYTPDIKDKFNYFVNVKKIHPSVNALMTFAYADYARQTEAMTDSDIITEIMKHLKDIYGSNIPQPTKMLRTKWQSNINSFGGYSYTAVGTEMRHFTDLSDAINNQVFFAGEHTHTEYWSTAHGAYLSGIREADKIIGLQ